MDAFPKVNFRYVLYPSHDLFGGLDLINFDNATKTWSAQLLGREDAKNTIKLGEGWFKNKLNEYYESYEIQ